MKNNKKISANFILAFFVLSFTMPFVKDLFQMRASTLLLLIPLSGIAFMTIFFLFPSIKLWIKIAVVVLYAFVVGYVIRTNTIAQNDLKGWWHTAEGETEDIRIEFGDQRLLFIKNITEDSVTRNEYAYEIVGKQIKVSEPAGYRYLVYDFKVLYLNNDSLTFEWEDKKINFLKGRKVVIRPFMN